VFQVDRFHAAETANMTQSMTVYYYTGKINRNYARPGFFRERTQNLLELC